WRAGRGRGGGLAAGGDKRRGMRPGTRAIGCRKCGAATTSRYHSFHPGSDATSDRSAYSAFFEIVTMMPTRPVASMSAAAHLWLPVTATATPIVASTNEKNCHLIECGRNAKGWTSVRYTEGNAAVPHTPALIRVPQSERTNGSGL